jgi:light-regulated signal transduction histidine kinase (bacteriophytochrome)
MRDSMQTMTGRVKERWDAARISSLDRQNMRLRDEVSHLKTRLDDERSETEDLKDALRSSPKVVKVKKRGGFLRVVVIGGAAYVLGTRAGRERYDQLVEWARSMRSKMERKTDEVASDVEDTASQMSAGTGSTMASARSTGSTATPRSTGPATSRTAEQRTSAAGSTGP